MHYVMSDIHGDIKKFKKMLQKIHFSDEDHLYILGDVIDRGAYGVEILEFIMNQDNITLLVGNHEYMMMEYLDNPSDQNLNVWYANGGYATMVKLERIGADRAYKIVDYLKNCPIVIPKLKVSDKIFYLTHAAPIVTTKTTLFSEALETDIVTCVWDRNFAKSPDTYTYSAFMNPIYKTYKNRYIIFGHTLTCHLPYKRTSPNKLPLISRFDRHVIAIDCGCIYGGRLACMRLEDFKEYYL